MSQSNVVMRIDRSFNIKH